MSGNHNTDIPRPEYPRPDFQRGTSEGIDWICLNGPWEFAFDPDDIGEQDQWFGLRSPTTDSVWTLQIQVPYPWESLAAWGDEEQADNAIYLSKNAYITPEEVTCGGLERGGKLSGTTETYNRLVSQNGLYPRELGGQTRYFEVRCRRLGNECLGER